MRESRVRVRLATPLPGSRPEAAPPRKAATAVVIDVLRATTTLTVALGHGARGVWPAATPEEARSLRARVPDALLCGERGGRPIAGFDVGNSPFEYPVPTVTGRILIFASTNGSRALRAAEGAQRRLLAAFVNLRAVVALLGGEREIDIVCAGNLGAFALEDAACAGLLCRRLATAGATLSDSAARLARAIAPQEEAEVRSLVQGSSHGRYLRSLGFARDVDFCAGLDVIDHAYEV